jgi:DNA-binding transcriptional MerR regulator
MIQSVYIREEFLSRINISEDVLAEWEKLKLVKPVGFTEDKIPYYSEHSIQRIEHIKKLLELGYDLEKIYKITRTVGLPVEDGKKYDSPDSVQYLTVGMLAEKVNISPRTIKHWEDKGIIGSEMRSDGGFRLYSETYIYLCSLIKDLQLFGYTLDEIKSISDRFRQFLDYKTNMNSFPCNEIELNLNAMIMEIKSLKEKMNLLKQGIRRWENLIKKKSKEIETIRNRNQKRMNIKDNLEGEKK